MDIQLETTCYDCEARIGFPRGMPEGAEIALCGRCGDRRRIAAITPSSENFSRTQSPLTAYGKRAAIAPLRLV